MSSITLTGLKGHHPLGFLAACGLLRIVKGEFEAKLGWKQTAGNQGDFTACISSSAEKTELELRNCLIEDSAPSWLSTTEAIRVAIAPFTASRRCQVVTGFASRGTASSRPMGVPIQSTGLRMIGIIRASPLA